MTKARAEIKQPMRLSLAGAGLLLAAFCLTAFGLVILPSASQSTRIGADLLFYKQLFWLGVALIAGVIGLRINMEELNDRKVAIVLGIGSLIGLILVLVPGIGIKVNGARRWVDIGVGRLQISEFTKIALIIILAHYLSAQQRHLKTFLRGFIGPCLIIGIFCMLILVEPDFGTAFLCGIVSITLLFLAGVRLLYYLPVTGLAMGLFSIAIMLDPTRLRRITAFLDVEAHKSDGAYQLWQSFLAFAAGGVWGTGLGQGRQQLSYLPEAHTDFIFPIIGEELGIVATVAIVALFMFILIVSMTQLRKAPNIFQFSLATGALLLITFQALINMSVVTGLLPTKGMSLPFISYGGSNLVVVFFLISLLVNCFRNWNTLPIPQPREL